MNTSSTTTLKDLAAKHGIGYDTARKLLLGTEPAMTLPYGKGVRLYNKGQADALVLKYLAEQAAKKGAPKPEPVALGPQASPQQDAKLHDKVDNLALGVDLLIEKVEQLSVQNAILLKAIEKLQVQQAFDRSTPIGPVKTLPEIEPGALDKFLMQLPSAEGNGAKDDAPAEPPKKRKPKVMVVGLPPASVATVCKEFADLDITFHSAERAKKLASSTARSYDRVIIMLDNLNWGLPILGTDVKRVDIKGGVSSLKTALTKAFVELADA